MTEKPPPRERTAVSARTIVVGLAIGLPMSALFLWLAVRGVDLGEVVAAITEASVGLVLLAIPCALLLLPFQGLRWRHLVEASPLPGRKAFVALVFVGSAITNVVPGRPGDLARGIWLARLGPIPIARSLTSVGVDRAVDVVTLFVYLLVCLPFVDRPDWLVALVLVGAGLSVLAAAVLAAAWWYSRKSSRGQDRLHLARDDKSWWRHQVSGVVRGLAVLSRPGEFLRALGLSFVGWMGPIAGGWLIAYSLDISLDLVSITFVMAVISLGSAIPSSPGMIGTYQWLAVVSMSVVGVGKADALAFSVLSQAAWYIPITLSGPFAAWWLTRLGAARRSGSEANTVVA